MLAGGRAARFDARPKGLAPVGGERVVDRVAAALRTVADELLVVANDAAADEWLPGVPRVADLRRGLGPLGGIHTALIHTGNAVLVVAWDMPFVSAQLLAALRRLGRAEGATVVPESAPGRLEPACALYSPACLRPLEDWLDSGRSGAAAFLDGYAGTYRMPLRDVARFGDPERLFFSVNTPAALERAETMARTA